MKKAISVLLAVAISLSQLALCAFAASDNPLQATDRITTQLAVTNERKQEIEAARIQRENMKDAAFNYGISASATNNLGFILNRKTMTKREYEAFKWSFIFSQFAIPLEDSLVDVFSQELFDEMLKENLDIVAVKNFLEYGGTNPEEVDITASMLEDANFTDLVETIKSNYTLLYLYREDNTALTFSDLLYGGPAINERFYVYDTILSSQNYNDVNYIYYNQELLADADKLPEHSISEPTKIPVAVYDAQFFLYLQIAVGTYCLRNSATVADLEAMYGTAQIVIDSYGNLCIYTSTGAKVLMPNFGNSLLTCTSSSNQICFYNKWITTLYSRTQRGSTGKDSHISDIFGDFCPIALGGNSDIDINDDSLEIEGDSQQSLGQYVQELPVKDGSEDLSGTILLVDPADIASSDGYLTTTFDFADDEEFNSSLNPAHDTEFTTPIADSVNSSYHSIAEYLSQHIWFSDEEYYLIHNGFHSDKTDNFEGRRHSTFTGTIYSNYCSGFTHSLSTIALQNPYPIINTGINFATLDTSSTSGKTHYYKLAMSLLHGSWRFRGSDRNMYTIYSGFDYQNNSRALLQAINNCVVLITTFDEDYLINDFRFMSDRAGRQSEGKYYTEIYLPDDIINVGQNCSAFFSDEKGMFVTKHNNYFSSSMEKFRELITHYLSNLLTTTGDSGSDAFDQHFAWQCVSGDQLTIQSAYTDTSKLTVIANDHQLYSISLPVALSTSIDEYELINNYDVFTPEEDEDIYDYTKLAKYLDKLYSYRDKIDALSGQDEFWISTHICQSAGIEYTFEDDSETYTKYEIACSDHKNKSTMRDVGDCVELLITRYTDSYTLQITEYDTNTKLKYKLSETLVDPNDKEGPTYWKLQETAYRNEDITENWLDDTDDRGLEDSDIASLLYMLNFMGMCGEASARLLSNRDASIASFKANLDGICADWGFDSSEFLYALACLQHKDIVDDQQNLARDIYFFDEYQYLLRNTTEISGVPGSQNSMDFSAITYYWDRAYLPELFFNQQVTSGVFDKMGIEQSDDLYVGTEPDSAFGYYKQYEQFLEDNHYSEIEYTLKDYIENKLTTGDTVPPFLYELGIQDQTFEEFLAKESKIQPYFDLKTQVYNYLEDDTIIVYPCVPGIRVLAPVHISSGIPDFVARWGSSFDADAAEKATEGFIVNMYSNNILLLALQCNTDYEHNYLAVSPIKEVETTHVTKEELMDKANQFFENPVSSLEYILSGFLYKMHSTIATGSLGSVFSANWLLESDIYKWVIDRYVAIVTIVIVVLLFLKLTQFAMSKTRDYGSIGRAVAGILAMCMVPLVVFNGFIWAFDATSSWALAGPTNKMLLGEVNYTVLGRVNSDPGVTAEYNAFREQFDKIQGEYDGITFEEMTDYGLDDPTYHQVPLSSYLRYLEFGTNYTDWYSSEGFVPIHIDHYDESMFYYFYDYIRAEFFNYIKNSDNATGSVTFIDVLDSERANLAKTKHSDEWKAAVTAISSAEGGIAQQTGEFLAMLNDTDYVYGLSINPSLADRYGGAYAKDLAGVYNLFNGYVNKDMDLPDPSMTFITVPEYIKTLKNAPWRIAINDAELMKVEEGINPDLWTDQNTIFKFYKEAELEGNYRSMGILDQGSYCHIMTSKLDLFNASTNGSSEKVDLRYNELVLTPLEEKLCQVTTNIYEKTLKALEYHSAEIKNESAIVLMALIATFEVSEAFDLEPTGPIPQTVTLDTVIRTAFIRDLDTLSSNSNTMYSIIAQGDSFGKVFIIFVLELTIAIAGILRIFIILYLTVGSFVVLALRLLHKAPATTDLVYGIVGNILALLALHALTLFLVVCAVEWVANATNAIPSLVLDIAVIVFIILMCCMLYKLVANLVKDAINMGGARIKAGVHQVVSGITNFLTHNAAIQSLATELAAGDVNVNANNVEGVSEEIAARELQHDKRIRAEGILSNMSEVEDELEEASDLAETTAESDPTTNRVSRNVSQEREISESAQSDLQEASSLADNAQN